VPVVAHASDARFTLTVWPAALGLVLLVANSTRMVQQVALRHHVRAPRTLLQTFALSVGLAGTVLLLLLALTGPGAWLVLEFVGGDRVLATGLHRPLLVCAVIPTLVALQNASQAFLIAEGRTGLVNVAAAIGALLLVGTSYALAQAGWSGSLAAAAGMTTALAAETGLLWLLNARPRFAATPALVPGA
jgi:hypothetical protein